MATLELVMASTLPLQDRYEKGIRHRRCALAVAQL